MSHIEHPFEPVFDSSSKILILGTMASPKSREVGFYYGHPQNRFWKVLAQVLDDTVACTTEERRAFLHRHHIALWDVLSSCDIIGASDASITNPVPSVLSPLYEAAPIRAVFTTGAKAYTLFKRFQTLPDGVSLIPLPSTSAANAAQSLETLIESYTVIKDYL